MTNVFVVLVYVVLFVIFGLIIFGKIQAFKRRKAKLAAMTEDERRQFIFEEKMVRLKKAQAAEVRQDNVTYGPLNSAMACPHCHAQGSVRTKRVVNKKGISGGKATAAILTGGVSMLATGLSRKEQGTQARCDSCKNLWVF